MSEPQKYPTGWDEAGVRDLIAHYDAQTEEEQAAEIEEALGRDEVTVFAVPSELAEEVRALIARRLCAERSAAPDRR